MIDIRAIQVTPISGAAEVESIILNHIVSVRDHIVELRNENVRGSMIFLTHGRRVVLEPREEVMHRIAAAASRA